MTPSLETTCPSCGEEVLIRREPIYEGFRKVGEKRLCASCGHVFDDEPEDDDAPKHGKRDLQDLIGADAGEDAPDIFSEMEKKRCCRYCKHYVVNPWMQRCGLHERNVEATDLCDDFERADDEHDTGEGEMP